MKYQSSYKLRKFVGYVDNPQTDNTNELYTRFSDRIKISQDEFVTEIMNKKEKLSNPSERHILSETYDEDTDKYRYSLHPVSSLYAKALYTIAA